MAANLPKKIGKYEVVDVIGKGGMGIVYRAKDPFLDRMVAIKIMTISYADHPDLLERFYREAKATAHLQHPNIVTVFELGEQDGSPYMVMQYLEGVSLESAFQSQKLPLLQKIDIIIETCNGLSYAHQRGIVHRDIKPGNIMVLKDGSVKIVDFGIARIGDTNFTRTGQFMGSLSYMSLEQLNDKLQVDQRTDVYSTGVVLYQIVTGSLPFTGENTGATLMKILNENPPPFSKFLSSFPPELETITLKALAKDREQRYSTAEEFALDLTELRTQLKQETIDVHMRQAELLLQKNELTKANDELMEVLRIDKQHARAMSLLRSLRKQIEKEQSAERARKLREQAEDALRREDFEPALSYVEQAIRLEATDVDLQQLRTRIQEAKAQIEHMREVFQRAETAHRAGHLDVAKQAIDEVMAFRPEDTRVKSLYRMIQKDLEDRLRQKRVESLLQSAQKEISGRNYTAAFEILKQAEKTDPDAPQLRALLERLNAAREQEKRRQDLEQISRQVEQAINADDYESAVKVADEGLRRFPNEPSLSRLRDLAETQRKAEETKSFVREKLAAARQVLDAGNAPGAVQMLQEALRKVPGNPHLESLIEFAKERSAQAKIEQAKNDYLEEANAAIGRGSYDEAIKLLEAGQLRFAASPEIDNLLRFAREQQAKVATQQEIDSKVRSAHDCIRAQEYDRAIQILEPVLNRAPNDELRIILEETRRRRDDLNRQIEAVAAKGQQFLDEKNPAKALEFLKSQPTAFQKSEKFRSLMAAATSMAAATRQAAEVKPDVPTPAAEQDWEAPPPTGTMVWTSGAPPVEAPRPKSPKVSPPRAVEPRPQRQVAKAKPQGNKKIVLIGGVAGIVIVAAIAGWVLSNSGKGKKEAVVPTSAAVETTPDTSKPVATGSLTVSTSVDGADIFVDDALRGSTSNKKLVLQLPPGSHQIRAEKQGFLPTAPQSVDIAVNQQTPLQLTLAAGAAPASASAPAKDSYLAIKGPLGGQVLIDGNPAGTLPGDSSLYVKVTPNSPHRIEVALAGYKSWSDSKSVKLGERLEVTAAMAPLPKPTVISFSSNPAKIQPGQSATLNWQTSNATEVRIEGVSGNVQTSGSTSVSPGKTTVYKLIAKGVGSTITGETTVVVATPNLPTVSITASPQSVQPGQSATLTWQSQNATEILINGSAHPGAEGSAAVTPDKTTTYAVEAKGPGGTATANVTVTVQPASAPPPPSAAPASPAASGGEASAIKAALDRLSAAYGTELLAEVKKAWPGMSKQQESGLKQVLSNKDMRAMAVQYDGCSTPSISGDSATTVCTEQMSYTFGGQRKTISQQVAISLKKAGGGWAVGSKEPKSK